MVPASDSRFIYRTTLLLHVGVGRCKQDDYFECVQTLADCRRFNSHRPTRRNSTVELRRGLSGGLNWLQKNNAP